MKKTFSAITAMAIIASVFSMFSVARADAPSYYTPTEYVRHEFADASEASAFSSDKTLAVSDGMLVLSDVSDYDVHYISTSVDIPAGQSFALEMSTDDLYANATVRIRLNGSETLMVRNSANNGAFDGDWIFYFDRVNGIKVFLNGTELSTDSSAPPYLSYSPTTPAKNITNVTVDVQGGTTLKPKFDYFYVYSFGDAQKYINEFDSSSELSNFKLGGGTSTVSNGKWVISNVNESWPQRIGIEADATQDLIVDFNLTHTNTYKRVEIQPNWKGLGNSGNIQYPSGEHTAIYNRSDDKIYVYQNGSKRYDTSLSLSGAPITVIGLGFLIGTGHSASLDYFNVYIQGMKAGVSDVTATGLKLHTNMPLDLTNSTFTAGGNACTVTKADEGFMTYDVTFAGGLTYGANYNLSASFETLTGRSYTDTIAFETPDYEEPTEYFGCDFDDSDDEGYFSITGAMPYEITNGSIRFTNTSGDKYSRITKSCSIPASDSFAVIFNLAGQIYQWVNTKICVNNTDLCWITQNGSSAGGQYMLVVKRGAGITLYKDGSMLTSSNNGKPYLNDKEGYTSIANSAITSIDIQPQVTGARTETISYFKAYKIPETFACAVRDTGYTDHVVLKTTHPLDIENTTASVGGAAGTITEVEGEFCKYKVTFASPLTVGQSYDLTVSAQSLTGETKSAVLPFAVSDSILVKSVETQILNASGTALTNKAGITDGNIYAKLNIFANAATDYKIYTAIYNSDFSKLLKVNMKQKSIAEDKNQIVQLATEVPSEAEGTVQFSVFVWEPSNYKALLPFKSVSLE